MVQGVRFGRVLANGGRHARTERYRGRHRKASAPSGLGTGVRVAVTIASAVLFVCLPQPSWADRAGAGAAPSPAAHSTKAASVMVKGLPGPFRLIRPARLG